MNVYFGNVSIGRILDTSDDFGFESLPGILCFMVLRNVRGNMNVWSQNVLAL